MERALTATLSYCAGIRKVVDYCETEISLGCLARDVRGPVRRGVNTPFAR